MPISDPAMRKAHQIIRDRKLRHIEVIITTSGVFARAYPDGFNKIVEARRAKAFGAKAEWTIAEAQKVQEESMAQIAHAQGENVDFALSNLWAALDRAT